MSKILGVKFRLVNKIRYFLSPNVNCKINNYVIAKNKSGISFGRIVQIIDKKSFHLNNEYELEPIIRVATKKDIVQNKLNQQKASYARQVCLEKINRYRINMKIVDVECTFDRKKILFYFSADGKVDFRDLVKDLARTLKTRIELRQIGVRDQSRILGGIGICGQPLCCSTFLYDFGIVSIKMAKEQGLSLNPAKLSGTCGRLRCCIQYEQNSYEDLIKNSPKVGDKVKTTDGEGKIVDINLINGFLKVSLDNNELFQVYHKNDVKLENK